MTDKVKELLSQIEDLLKLDSQSKPTKLNREQGHNIFPEGDGLSFGKRRLIRLKLLDDHSLQEVLEKVGRIMRHEFSDLSVFLKLTSDISEIAQDTDGKKMGDVFTRDNIFIIPIVDKEDKVIGRSVFCLCPKKIKGKK